ncbi:hypothetical protein G5I_02129 [Acromyrmex echinatior]|uniref:Uncharacterized protein n=1 Tax=Acromyrmex echinatior TaxID=103372 RepID=F4W9H7_ACREC|nr:hypothetical protein G5I_02129 [Acromyrmex echinatior]
MSKKFRDGQITPQESIIEKNVKYKSFKVLELIRSVFNERICYHVVTGTINVTSLRMNFRMEFNRTKNEKTLSLYDTCTRSLRNSHAASYIGAKRAKDFARYGTSNGLKEHEEYTETCIELFLPTLGVKAVCHTLHKFFYKWSLHNMKYRDLKKNQYMQTYKYADININEIRFATTFGRSADLQIRRVSSIRRNTEARDGTKVTVNVAVKRISWNRRGALIKRAVCLLPCQEIVSKCFGLLSQMQNALKRGVTYGILKKTDGQYSLPTDNEITRQEVAAQEIGLLDLYCRRKIHRSKGNRTRHNKRTGRSQRVVCRKKDMRKSRGCGSRSYRRRRGGSRSFDRRVHDGKSKIEPILVDKLTDKSTKSNSTMTGVNVIDDIKRSNSSNMPSEQWDRRWIKRNNVTNMYLIYVLFFYKTRT